MHLRIDHRGLLPGSSLLSQARVRLRMGGKEHFCAGWKRAVTPVTHTHLLSQPPRLLFPVLSARPYQLFVVSQQLKVLTSENPHSTAPPDTRRIYLADKKDSHSPRGPGDFPSHPDL